MVYETELEYLDRLSEALERICNNMAADAGCGNAVTAMAFGATCGLTEALMVLEGAATEADADQRAASMVLDMIDVYGRMLGQAEGGGAE